MNPEARHVHWPFHTHLRFRWGAVLLLAVLAAACAEDGVVPEPRSGVVFAVNLERGFFVLHDTRKTTMSKAMASTCHPCGLIEPTQSTRVACRTASRSDRRSPSES